MESLLNTLKPMAQKLFDRLKVPNIGPMQFPNRMPAAEGNGETDMIIEPTRTRKRDAGLRSVYGMKRKTDSCRDEAAEPTSDAKEENTEEEK